VIPSLYVETLHEYGRFDATDTGNAASLRSITHAPVAD